MVLVYVLKFCFDLKLIFGRMLVYQEEFCKIREIFVDYVIKIELLLLDEVYLDVIDSQLYKGSVICIVEVICYCIQCELNLIVFVGVVFCKFVVKIVSDENKFNGLCVVVLDEFDSFVCRFLLKKILGVGEVML